MLCTGTWRASPACIATRRSCLIRPGGGCCGRCAAAPCESEPPNLARIERLLRLSGTAAERCLFLTHTPCFSERHWVDRLVCFGRLTPPAFAAGDYTRPSPTPPRPPPPAV